MPSREKTMKNRSSKRILVFLALGLIGCVFCVQQAQAVHINGGVITIAGGAQLDNANIDDATQVVSWVDPQVQSVSGNIGLFVSAGQSVTMNSWTFGSGATALWSVGGFTFDLIASTIVLHDFGILLVSGTGIVTGHGQTFNGTWMFSTQGPGSGDIFSFSASSNVPDGGATVALLGLSLAGIEGIRRKLMKKRS
jgi:hypothetical protein